MLTMVNYFTRLIKRLAVLLPGLVIAYFSVKEIFPYFDSRLPLGLAILFTYMLAAYVLIPAAIRLLRIIFPPNHLPLYCVTPDGFASDPLNIGVMATRRALITAMQDAGWHMADPHRGRYLFKHGLSILLDRPYDNAPVSSLYLFGRKQDLAFEIPLGNHGSRHHVRFWATTYQEGKKLNVKTIHWHNRKEHIKGDDLLWVGAASLDNGVGFIRHNMQVTHSIHPDTDTERELIVKSLEEIDIVDSKETIKLDKPYRLINRTWRGHFLADGKMTIVRFKQPS